MCVLSFCPPPHWCAAFVTFTMIVAPLSVTAAKQQQQLLLLCLQRLMSAEAARMLP